MMERSQLREEEFEALCLHAYFEAQESCETKGTLLRPEVNVLGRFRHVFEFIGAIQLGLLVACISILLNFMIVLMILHLDVNGVLGLFTFGG